MNKIKLTTGVSLLFSFSILCSQNVGIGTITPASKLHIKGSANTSQLIIDANGVQSNIFPLIKLRNSFGTDLLWIHSDDSTNTFMGLHAGKFNNAAAMGLYNTFIGGDSGYSNNTGELNTAIGNHALYSNTIGFHNTAIGTGALLSNIAGINNTATGTLSLVTNTTGVNNTANGREALNSNDTGSNNTAVGYEALSVITTGNNNTAIGSGANVSAADISNATAIGANAYAGSSNSVVIGSINGVNNATASSNVGIGTTTPNPSSLLDLSSTTKGLLPPRMTTSQRNSIVNPVAGLLIWCTNCSVYGQLQVHNGFVWTNILGGIAADVPSIGDSEGGGKIAYILQDGDPGFVAGENHGLIAAPFDQISSPWGCLGMEIPGAGGIVLGTGNQNTLDIVTGCSASGIAARLCNDLVFGGYSDWYLPSVFELAKLYTNRAVLGGFGGGYYWSSSEWDINQATTVFFTNGSQINRSKSEQNSFRPIRSF